MKSTIYERGHDLTIGIFKHSLVDEVRSSEYMEY